MNLVAFPPRKTLGRGLGLALGLAVVSGCGLEVHDEPLSVEGQAIVADASDVDPSTAFSVWLSVIPALSFEGTTPVTFDKVVAEQANAPTFFQPKGCVGVDREANVVTYSFDQCTGPWGLIKLSGAEQATFAPGANAGALTVSLASQGLTENGAPIEHAATVGIDVGGPTKRIDWSGTFTGMSVLGKHVSHEADLHIAITGAATDTCVTVNGTTSSTIGLRGIDRSFQNFARCGAINACPTGTIVATGRPSGYVVTLTFDGTTSGHATGENGGGLVFSMSCTPPTAT